MEGPCFAATDSLPYQDNTFYMSPTWMTPVHRRHFGRGSQDRVNESDEGFVGTAVLCFVSMGAGLLQKSTHFPGGLVSTSQKVQLLMTLGTLWRKEVPIMKEDSYTHRLYICLSICMNMHRQVHAYITLSRFTFYSKERSNLREIFP